MRARRPDPSRLCPERSRRPFQRTHPAKAGIRPIQITGCHQLLDNLPKLMRAAGATLSYRNIFTEPAQGPASPGTAPPHSVGGVPPSVKCRQSVRWPGQRRGRPRRRMSIAREPDRGSGTGPKAPMRRRRALADRQASRGDIFFLMPRRILECDQPLVGNGGTEKPMKARTIAIMITTALFFSSCKTTENIDTSQRAISGKVMHLTEWKRH